MNTNWFYLIFINPLVNETSHNAFNILVYWMLFLLLFYGAYKLMKKIKIKIDFKFFLTTLPFILAGSILRAFVDHSLYPRTLFTVTPGIYLVFFTLFILSLLTAWFIERKWKINYYKSVIAMGLVLNIGLALPKIAQLAIRNTLPLTLSLLAFAAFITITIILAKKFKIAKFLESKLAKSALFCQVFDGINTSFLLFFVGGFEKHPIPRLLITATGTPFSFLIAKIIIASFTVWTVNKYIKETQFKNTLFIALAVVGLGPALRNFISYLITSII